MTATDEQLQLTIPARLTAIAWANAFLASSNDKTRPTLFRTLSLEFFKDGLHLIGCDGHALFRTWVPVEGASWPAMNRKPARSLVVMDIQGFAIGFMKLLARVTSEEEHAGDQLTITTAQADDDASPALGSEFTRERIVIRACGQRIDLMLMEGQYPDWRKLKLGVEAVERLDSLTIGPAVFGLLGRLREVFAVDLQFHGAEKHVAFTARGVHEVNEVRGLLMPMRKPEPKATEEASHG
jgi:hypothetical protein